MGTLRNELEQIASTFVSSVLAAMRTASLSDLAETSSDGSAAGPAAGGRPRGRPRGRVAAAASVVAAPAEPRRGRGGRRRRASPDEVAKQKDLALNTARQLKSGFSKGEVMSKAASKVDLGRAL